LIISVSVFFCVCLSILFLYQSRSFRFAWEQPGHTATMHATSSTQAFVLALAAASLTAAAPAPTAAPANIGSYWGFWSPRPWSSPKASGINVQLGPRPYYLVDNMAPSALKTKLQSCSEGPFKTSGFSISHRGAPLQFPEHSRQGYEAAIRMGAGKCNH
jgi:glycerophosphoryl diester phosphodiesterase